MSIETTPLAQYLKSAGIKQHEFAALISCSQAAVARYVNGQRLPEREIMIRIAEATSGAVTPNDFFAITTEAAA